MKTRFVSLLIFASYTFFTTSFMMSGMAQAQSTPPSTPSPVDSIELFCKVLTDPRVTEKTSSFKETFKTLGSIYLQVFAPKKMVQVQKLGELPNQQIPSIGEKVIFTLLPRGDLNENELKILDQRTALQKEFKDTGILRRLAISQARKNLNLESCMTMVKENPDVYAKTKAYLDFSIDPTTDQVVKKTKNHGIDLQLDGFFKKFIRQGWRLHRVSNYTEVLNTLTSNPKITEIALVLHTRQSTDAEILNANESHIDNRFFQAFPNQIRKVILLTCHSKAIIESYHLNQNDLNFDLYYATPSARFEEQLKDTTPINSRNAFLKAASHTVSNHAKPKRDCILEIESNRSHHAATVDMGIHLLGALNGKHTELAFDCAWADTKQVVTANYILNPDIPKTSLEITSMKIRKPDGTTVSLTVTEKFKGGNSDQHLITIGRY